MRARGARTRTSAARRLPPRTPGRIPLAACAGFPMPRVRRAARCRAAVRRRRRCPRQAARAGRGSGVRLRSERTSWRRHQPPRPATSPINTPSSHACSPPVTARGPRLAVRGVDHRAGRRRPRPSSRILCFRILLYSVGRYKPELSSGFLLVPVRPIERLDDRDPLDLRQRPMRRNHEIACRPRFLPQRIGQIGGRDFVSLGDEHRAFDRVFQLTDVPRPAAPDQEMVGGQVRSCERSAGSAGGTDRGSGRRGAGCLPCARAARERAR